MTRTELLAARANDVVEAALKEGVCLGERECLIVGEAVLFALLEVEREKEEALEAYAWRISPAMAQAKIDELHGTVERQAHALAHVREALRGMVEIFGHHDGYTVVRAARLAMQEDGY